MAERWRFSCRMVLFRGAAEEKIRKALLEQGVIDAVIGLPANLFFGTPIPTTLIILKKNRTDRDVLFIDASKGFEKGKNRNILEDKHIQKIFETYKKRKDVDKYAHVTGFDKIEENDFNFNFNLNIPRYVDTFEEEEPIDIVAVSKEIVSLNKEIAQAENEFLAMLDELQMTEDTKDIIEATKEAFEGITKKYSKNKKKVSSIEQLSLML